jgi:hypothetical protein
VFSKLDVISRNQLARVVPDSAGGGQPVTTPLFGPGAMTLACVLA